ncbi:hypothetical protein BG004_004605 [Podila humilis]|nr:hypothetical protein BG004_004605 [Podila humilis]
MSEKRKEVRYIAQKFANAILADTSSYIISTDGLQAINAFLDELLFILIDTAKGLETSRIKAAVYQTFPSSLGKNAIVEAELEAKSYLDMGGKDTSNHMGNGQSATSSIFNADSDETRVEQVFEQFRAKCQYYSKLGERLGSPAGNPSNSVVVPTLIAIYVTAVMEHVAEYVLQVASTIADRQDHADMVTVREVYVALQEDRQIESIFEIMILKAQLQKRFRNSLIMPGTGAKPEEQTPATVKRSGSWGKQLRLGNSDKPKLDVQLPTDIEDDILIDPNRPQFGDWDMPPDEESKLKKKNDFEMLFSSGETMKVSLTPNRLRTIEVHRKAGALGGAAATRSSSRAASVLNGKDRARRPSTSGSTHGGAPTGGPGGRKNNMPSAPDAQVPPMPSAPNVPAIPSNFGVAQPILKKQAQQAGLNEQKSPHGELHGELHGLGIADNGSKAHAHMENIRTSSSTFESKLTLSTVGPTSPVTSSQSPVSPTGSKSGDGSLLATTQATNDLVQFLGNASPTSSFSDQSTVNEAPMTPTSENGSTTTKKDNPIKNFMGRLGRNSIQRTSMDSNVNTGASSPTSIRSFTITGPSPSNGSTNGSINGTIVPPSGPNAPFPIERRGSEQQQFEGHQQQIQHSTRPPVHPTQPHIPTRTISHESRGNLGFPLPPDHTQMGLPTSSTSHRAMNSPLDTLHNPTKIPAPLTTNGQYAPPPPMSPPVQRPMSPSVEAGGMPIPSRNASLNHDVTSPTKASFSNAGATTNSFDIRSGMEAGLPRPLSPRPASPRPSSPRPSSPMQSTPPQSHNHTPYQNSAPGTPTSAGVMSPSPLSKSMSGHNISPSGSSTSLIMYGKVQHIQEKLSKTIQPPVHGFKQQDHLQNRTNRISLEGTIRANPFYQQDRSSSVRSSLADITTATATAAVLGAAIDEEQEIAQSVTKSKSAGTEASKATSSSSSSRGSSESVDRDSYRTQGGMMTPATSPEVGGLSARLPSATTRSITAAAAAALAAKHNQHIATAPAFTEGNVVDQEQQESPVSPTSKKRTSIGSLNGPTHRQFHVYNDDSMQNQKSIVGNQNTLENGPEEEEDEDDDEEEERRQLEQVYMRPRQPRPMSTANRHSIFVDEAAQAMDALSRARHRQSMRLEGNEDEEDEDEEYDDDDLARGIEPPEKWHYSDLEEDYDEDEDYEDEDDEDEDDEKTEDGERRSRRRRKHESFMSAKSVLPPNGSTVSLVDAYANANDTQDEDDESELDTNIHNNSNSNRKSTEEVSGRASVEKLVQSLEVQDDQGSNNAVGNDNDDIQASDLIPAGAGSNDDNDDGEDEDESEDSEDLEDNDDEEGQDRRIYLQNLRAQKREARRLERLAEGRGSKKSNKGQKNVPSSLETASSVTTATTTTMDKRKTLKKGRSKENLRRDPDRPQTPTTPVPTTQVIPLTPTDFVLIRQKLFAAGNFEASMRMLDTIFHAAMAKMVEGRERGVQTDAVSFLELEGDDEHQQQQHQQRTMDNERSESKTAATATATATASASISTSTSTSEFSDQKQPIVVAPSKSVLVQYDDDDDEDRVVEWLLGGV